MYITKEEWIMKLHFLGTCAGTEPMPTRKHASFALECNGKLYWFDAGEGCSYTAHNMGLDLQKIYRIIISHPHMDHVGGLANLIWNCQKLHYVRKQSQEAECVHIHIPCLETWEGVQLILKNSEFGRNYPFALEAHETHEGVLFDDGTVSVIAMPNNHLAPRDGKIHSYSFLIQCEGKRIVYSGDVREYCELDPLIADYCDALILETGHFKIDDAYAFVSSRPVEKLYFTHNGREFLHHPEESAEKVNRLFGSKAVISYDTMTAEL